MGCDMWYGWQCGILGCGSGFEVLVVMCDVGVWVVAWGVGMWVVVYSVGVWVVVWDIGMYIVVWVVGCRVGCQVWVIV